MVFVSQHFSGCQEAFANDPSGINNNMAPHYRRATAIGIQQTIGNIAGIVAPQVYRAAPYRLGNWCSLASVLISMGLIAT